MRFAAGQTKKVREPAVFVGTPKPSKLHQKAIQTTQSKKVKHFSCFIRKKFIPTTGMAYHYVLTWSLLASVIATIVAFGLIGIGGRGTGEKTGMNIVGSKCAKIKLWKILQSCGQMCLVNVDTVPIWRAFKNRLKQTLPSSEPIGAGRDRRLFLWKKEAFIARLSEMPISGVGFS